MCAVYENFLALPEDKRQRICNAALRGFGRYGYKKTSVEQIVTSAGIAKSMVFHYFGSKKGLFEYLTQYCGDAFLLWFGNLGQALAGLDFIEQYRRITQIKLRVFLAEPGVFEFATMLYMHPENQRVSEKVEAVCQHFQAMRENLFAAIQNGDGAGHFRPDIDPEQAKKYVRWLIDGYAQELMAALGGQPLADMELDRYWDDFDRILVDLKKLFYTEQAEEG